MNKPENIHQCYSKNTYIYQINQNFNKINFLLRVLGSEKECDFSEYQQLLTGMQEKAFNILEAFSNCTEDDCSDAVSTATDDYVLFRKTQFTNYTVCGVSRFSADCARIILTVRPLAYGSVENIITSMMACSKLKLDSKPWSTQVYCIEFQAVEFFITIFFAAIIPY